MVAVGAWYIWWQRREAVKGNSVAPPSRTSFAIQALAANYKGAESRAPPHEIPWCKPAAGTYKLNVDARYFNNGMGASGVVIRSDKGEPIAGAGDPLIHMLDVDMAEAMALQKGLHLVEMIGCRPVVVETDSLKIVQAFNERTDVWSPYTAIIMDCFQTVRRIGQVKVQHCPREANKVAHKIARFVFNSKVPLVWDGDPPSFIATDVLNDVSVFVVP